MRQVSAINTSLSPRSVLCPSCLHLAIAWARWGPRCVSAYLGRHVWTHSLLYVSQVQRTVSKGPGVRKRHLLTQPSCWLPECMEEPVTILAKGQWMCGLLSLLSAFGVHGGRGHSEVLKSPTHFPVSFVKPWFYKDGANSAWKSWQCSSLLTNGFVNRLFEHLQSRVCSSFFVLLCLEFRRIFPSCLLPLV